MLPSKTNMRYPKKCAGNKCEIDDYVINYNENEAENEKWII